MKDKSWYKDLPKIERKELTKFTLTMYKLSKVQYEHKLPLELKEGDIIIDANFYYGYNEYKVAEIKQPRGWHSIQVFVYLDPKRTKKSGQKKYETRLYGGFSLESKILIRTGDDVNQTGVG